MRTTIALSLASLLGACVAPIGDRQHDDFGPDAGVDGGAAETGCSNLKIVTMNLTVSGTANFNNLPTTCWKLNGKLTITGPAISSVAKLGDLREVSDLEIDHADLTKFDTQHVVEVSGDIYIHNNDRLADLANVVAKTQVRSIRVEYNPALPSVGGLARAGVVSGATTIANNIKLTSIDLSSAQRLEGGLSISDNTVLTTVQLTGLQSVGNLSITRNTALTNISNMSALTNIHGSYTVSNNDALVTLGTFGMGVFVDANVAISNNAKLADTGAIERAQRIIGTVAINYNPALDYTKAHAIDCCVLTGAVQITGDKTTQCGGNHYCIPSGGNCPY